MCPTSITEPLGCPSKSRHHCSLSKETPAQLSTAPCTCAQTCCACGQWWSYVSLAPVRHMAWTRCCSQQFWCAKGPVVEVYPTGRVTPAQFSLAGRAGVQNSPKERGHSLGGQHKRWAALAGSPYACICRHVPTDRPCIWHSQC